MKSIDYINEWITVLFVCQFCSTKIYFFQRNTNLDSIPNPYPKPFRKPDSTTSPNHNHNSVGLAFLTGLENGSMALSD